MAWNLKSCWIVLSRLVSPVNYHGCQDVGACMYLPGCRGSSTVEWMGLSPLTALQTKEGIFWGGEHFLFLLAVLEASQGDSGTQRTRGSCRTRQLEQEWQVEVRHLLYLGTSYEYIWFSGAGAGQLLKLKRFF